MPQGNYPMKAPARPQASTPPKTASIKGEAYPVLNLQGKAYAPVHQRVESAHKHGGYSVISCEFKEIFEMRVCEVWIEIDGKRYPGTAELKKNFDRPLEDAQTSAIGRALAFAGYNIETAIASQEDMASVLQERNISIVESEPPALPEPEIPLPEGREWKEYACDLATLAKCTKAGLLAEIIRLTGVDISKQRLTDAGWEVVARHFYPLAKVMSVEAEKTLPEGA